MRWPFLKIRITNSYVWFLKIAQSPPANFGNDPFRDTGGNGISDPFSNVPEEAFEDPFPSSGNGFRGDAFPDSDVDAFTASDPFSATVKNIKIESAPWGDDDFSNAQSFNTLSSGYGSSKGPMSTTSSLSGASSIESKRQDSIQELISTEESYMTDMKIVKEVLCSAWETRISCWKKNRNCDMGILWILVLYGASPPVRTC
jgi:hypothetical protein